MPRYPGSPVGSGRGTKASITAVQERLNVLHCGPIEEDGEWGPETEDAVRLFQARSRDANGDPLQIDGVVGSMTWAALFFIAISTAPAPAGGLLGAVLRIAASKIGVQENPPLSNRGPDVDVFLRSVGLNPQGQHYAWCAGFVYWCFSEAARELTAAGTATNNPAPKEAGVKNMWRAAGESNLLRLSPRQIVAKPELVKPGFLFFLDTGGSSGHVGFIERVAGVVLTTIEGNSNDDGSRDGIGVFRLTKRRIDRINLGVADFSSTFS